MFLTADDVQRLTGRLRFAAQRRALDRLGHTTAQMTRTYLRGREVTTVEPLKRKAT